MKTVLLLAITACLLLACDSKSGYLREYESFSAEVERNLTSYSQEDWIALDAEHAELSGPRYRAWSEEMTPPERERVAELRRTYQRAKTKRVVEEIKGHARDAFEGFQELVPDDIKRNF